MTQQEVESAIRKAHIINWALFICKTVMEKISLVETDLRNYLFLGYVQLIDIKNSMKETYKKYDIKLLAPDKDLETVFIEAENLVKSSFPHRALGFISVVYPEFFNVKEILGYLLDKTKGEDIKFSHELFKDMLENPNE